MYSIVGEISGDEAEPAQAQGLSCPHIPNHDDSKAFDGFVLVSTD
jgi:hypothetical protein